jgi:hypothetical protein
LWSSMMCTETSIYFYPVHIHHSLLSCNNKVFLVITYKLIQQYAHIMAQKTVKLHSNMFQSWPPPSPVQVHGTKHWYFKLFMQVEFPDDEELKTLRWQLCCSFIACKNKVMSLVKPQSIITCGLLAITITYFRNILMISENCKILFYFCLPHLLLHTPIILRDLLHNFYHS